MSKITAEHLARNAYVYVRQSTRRDTSSAITAMQFELAGLEPHPDTVTH